jgi:hypothetical protein
MAHVFMFHLFIVIFADLRFAVTKVAIYSWHIICHMHIDSMCTRHLFLLTYSLCNVFFKDIVVVLYSFQWHQ